MSLVFNRAEFTRFKQPRLKHESAIGRGLNRISFVGHYLLQMRTIGDNRSPVTARCPF